MSDLFRTPSYPKPSQVWPVVLILIGVVHVILIAGILWAYHHRTQKTAPTLSITHVRCYTVPALQEDLCVLVSEQRGQEVVFATDLRLYLPTLTEEEAEICTDGYCYDTHHGIIGLHSPSRM